MSREKFFSSLDHGFAFCDVVLGWDVKEPALRPTPSYTVWQYRLPRIAPVRILLASFAGIIPFEDGILLLFLAEFDKQAEAGLARAATLRRVMSAAQAMGFDLTHALGIRFFHVQRDAERRGPKGFRDLIPYTGRIGFGYSMIRNSVHARAVSQILGNGSEAWTFDRGPAYRNRPPACWRQLRG